MSRKVFFSACKTYQLIQITMYYYVGFAYLMMRRYADAIRTFSNILLYIQRTRGLFQVKTMPLTTKIAQHCDFNCGNCLKSKRVWISDSLYIAIAVWFPKKLCFQTHSEI